MQTLEIKKTNKFTGKKQTRNIKKRTDTITDIKIENGKIILIKNGKKEEYVPEGA